MNFTKNICYIIVILSFPLQFVFHNLFYSYGVPSIQKNWDMSHVSKTQLDVANIITKYCAAFSPLAFIFISYKIKKLRKFMSILFFIGGVIFLLYLPINEHIVWFIIILRILNGILVGFFMSATIAYLMHYSINGIHGFNGSLIEVAITLGICITELMFYVIPWKIVGVLFSVQSFLFGGLIWLVPEYFVIPKSLSHDYIYRKPFLKNLLIMILIMIIQCFSGIGFMINNCARLLSGIGIELHSSIQSTLTNFISCLSAFISAFIIDVVSARYMWAFSSLGIVISLLIYDITLKIECPKWVGVFAVFLYFLFFGLGEGTIPWMLCGLIFPESLMIESGSINTFVNRFMDAWFDHLLNLISKSLGEFGSVAFNACITFFGIWVGLYFIPKMNISTEDKITII
ncbi:glucose import [Tritrichomonas musculus]|uniref:Glucose import n=1 Tax=Tritrichomonas musculus TaxID=1915356 RepID=A0ABR2HV46_9EUKA